MYYNLITYLLDCYNNKSNNNIMTYVGHKQGMNGIDEMSRRLNCLHAINLTGSSLLHISIVIFLWSILSFL